MREIRLSGSEGGGAPITLSLPLSPWVAATSRRRHLFWFSRELALRPRQSKRFTGPAARAQTVFRLPKIIVGRNQSVL